MYHYRLLISYKGTHYYGWQDLGAREPKPTVQTAIQQVLDKICKYQPSTISAASRTDAGVHAQGQVAKISLPLEIETEKLQLGMNSLLPSDIRVLQCEPCTAAFNANKDTTSKEYHYYFATDLIHNTALNDIVAHFPSPDDNETQDFLDIDLMSNACKVFIGEHDFYSFAKRDVSSSSTFRTIFSCELLQATPLAFGTHCYYIKIVGNGFLKHMVRYIVGALIALGRNEISLEDIREALASRKDTKISSSAKARGLHLINIDYA